MLPEALSPLSLHLPIPPSYGQETILHLLACNKEQYSVCYLASLELLSIKLHCAKDIKEYLLFHTGVCILSTAMKLFQSF